MDYQKLRYDLAMQCAVWEVSASKTDDTVNQLLNSFEKHYKSISEEELRSKFGNSSEVKSFRVNI